MRDKFNPLTKFYGTLTVPSPGTESIGLPADTLAVMPAPLAGVFAVPPGQLYLNGTTSALLPGLVVGERFLQIPASLYGQDQCDLTTFLLETICWICTLNKLLS